MALSKKTNITSWSSKSAKKTLEQKPNATRSITFFFLRLRETDEAVEPSHRTTIGDTSLGEGWRENAELERSKRGAATIQPFGPRVMTKASHR
jgi:hypothetical protein